jgi:sugar lactone lactonase YvrE
MDALTPVVTDLLFAESPRWHEDRLWFSDCFAQRVLVLDPSSGEVDEVARFDGQPSGLGWDEHGRLLVVSIHERQLLGVADGKTELVADLAAVAGSPINDMTVGPTGIAYIGSMGYDMHAGEIPGPAQLLGVTSAGEARVLADGLSMPNGMVVTTDGSTLVVAETMGNRLTAFSIAADGSLSEQREWAKLGAATPDGICLDAEGAIWVASPMTREILRVREGGEVADRIEVEGRRPVACALGGDDRRTLYVCTVKSLDPARATEMRAARIEQVMVAVAGV